MKKVTVLAAFVLVCAVAAESSATQYSEVRIKFDRGFVYLVAQDALASDVLGEWARAGGTRIEGAELLGKQRVSLALDRVPEWDAIAAILGEGFVFVTHTRDRVLSGYSLFDGILIGIEQAPPEARYEYYVPEKSSGGEVFGDPVYEILEKLPRAPEAANHYYVPEKSLADFGPAFFEPIDPKWQDPERVYDYYAKELFGDWPTEPGDPGQLPKVYPEVRYNYYVPPKSTATPQ